MSLSNHGRAGTPLAKSSLIVTIIDLVAEYEISHVFRNDSAEPIEAIYSFPVPLDSAFMGMKATLGGETLSAHVLPAHAAARNYDDAIADGDSAVLLERLEPGMLCVSLGNLTPGEEGEIVLTFAAPLRTADGAARFSLPLVHRPRYGRSSLEECDEPQPDFAAEHPLDALIRVEGLLARAPVSCATHAARFSSEADAQLLRLNAAMLDRDLVLVFDLPSDFSGQARLVSDGDQVIGMLSFSTPPSTHAGQSSDVCLVLDGSGSMMGDAIEQSRAALRALADALVDDDRIQVLRFGSSVVPLFRRPLKASLRVREAMALLAETVESDLGGTEMARVLKQAVDGLEAIRQHPERSQAIILVTDGGVRMNAIQESLRRAAASGIRIFVVAVGSCAGVDVLEPLAAGTRAVLERAVPAEPIDAAVMRQLRRVRESGPLEISIDWTSSDAQPLPLDVTYPGDAVTAIALLPAGQVFTPRVRIAANAEVMAFALDRANDMPALRALAGHAAWCHADAETREQLALRYGLITDETSAVLVKVRAVDDKAEGMPHVVPVAHMVAHGMVAGPIPFDAACSMSMPLSINRSMLSVPAFMRRSTPAPTIEEARLSPERVLRVRIALRSALESLLFAETSAEFSLAALLTLIDPDLHDDVHQHLRELRVELLDRRSAFRLLHLLTDEGVGHRLTDDQEACLATEQHGLG